MGWEVVFAPRSESDLAKIVSHIVNNDPAAAIRFGETLINKAESLADVPGMGPLLPGKATTRFLPVGSYLIIHQPDDVCGLCGFSDFGIRRGGNVRHGKMVCDERGQLCPRAASE